MTFGPLAHALGDITPERFLTEYWQKKPLLIRQAFPDFSTPIDPDTLAGLACEAQVESRLVLEQGDAEADQGKPWALREGPFTEATFNQLPEKNWTLLVQAVDHYVPEVRDILNAFRFVPSWRLDDVMISYAPEGGSVGPHIDYYDVFLLQASGTRRWQLGEHCDQTTPIRQDTRLRILESFEPQEDENGRLMDWVLEPGDLLYLPPQLAHYGRSTSEDCTTWSVGFRALSAEEILCGASDFIAEKLTEDQRYADPDLKLQANPGEITPEAKARLKALMLAALDNDQALSEWFGRAMTQTKYPDQLIEPETPWQTSDWQEALASGEQLIVTEGSRFAFERYPDGHGSLYVDGNAYPFNADLMPLIETLCAQFVFDTASITPTFAINEANTLITTLLNQGSLSLIDPNDQD